MEHNHTIHFIQHHGKTDTVSVYSKDEREISCANETAVEEHEHVVIKLASYSDSSSDTYTVFGLRAYENLLYWILVHGG